MKAKIYIDGQAGTTGLRIRDWLAGRDDLEVAILPEALRKDARARRELVLAAEIVVLCLPDDAAHEVAEWTRGSATRVIDASSTHRVTPGWVYGLPELQPAQRDLIRKAKFVSNPGCHPSAAILLLRPLVEAGLVAADAPLAIRSLSGYSGGGRTMIAKWETDPALRHLPFEAPYSVQAVHKHIPEMVKYAGLRQEPQFSPAVGPFRCGMRVQVPLPAALLKGVTARALWESLQARYRGEEFVRVWPYDETAIISETAYDPRACNDTNRIELRVLPHPSGHAVLMATLDNLGKGACGMAIQSLNLMLGRPEGLGLPK